MKLLCLYLLLCFCVYAKAPQLFLLKTYKDDLNVTGWVMSEKYDGVRAMWEGKRLISRSGKVFNPPLSFLQGFPSFALDGELWTQRGDFENIVSIVNTKEASDRWDKLYFMVFEVPEQDGDFFERLGVLQAYLKEHKADKIKIVKQIRIGNQNEVKVYFDRLVHEGAEGVVIRDPQLPYYVGRTKEALKYKPYKDAECKVVSVVEGSGKYKGMMGALKCDFDGKIIKIGSGFSDKERKLAWSRGTRISFKYYGLTRLGNPKYPVFLRLRKIE